MENEITNASMEMEEKLTITSDGNSYLTTTAKWATFLSILGFVGTGIMVLVGVFMMFISPMTKLGSTFGIPVALFGLLYLLMAVLYFFPAYYLYNFASKTKLALYNNRQDELDEGLKNLKKMFKFLGIMTIIIVSLYLIMIPAILVFSFAKGMMH